MDINIRTQDYYKDKTTQKLVNFLKKNEQDLSLSEAIVHYEFPFFKNIDEEIQYPSLMLIDPLHGVILFQCDASSKRELTQEKITDIDERLSEIYNLVRSKLIKTKGIRKKRDELAIQVSAFLYFPYLSHEDKEEFIDCVENDALIVEDPEIKSCLDTYKSSEPISLEILKETIAVLEGAKGIIKPKARKVDETLNTKGGILASLEKEIANFDRSQKYAAMTQLEGPQRIRGLAGSGKTIVLAMKAALIHLRSPNAQILYTFNTKSLYDYIKRLITRFYRQHEDSDPNWDKIHIRHAWGGSYIPGVYSEACRDNGIQPMNFREANSRSDNPFDYICKLLLKQKNGNLEKSYDYVLIDEAQDFKSSFYQLCRQIVKNDCIVWGYDELQNIFDVKIQSTIDTFKNENYNYQGIDLPNLQKQYPDLDNDIVLQKCYRNPLEILVLAHALGFGIYNSQMIQMLENNEHWEDLGYEIHQGNCQEGDRMIIHRPIKNSPLKISKNQNINELIGYYVGEDYYDEINWICNSVRKNIQEDKLNPEDILIICIDKYARKYFKAISNQLHKINIQSINTFDSAPSGKSFFIDNAVTLSTIYKAKGNEAAMVYLIGLDTFHSVKDSRIERNKLFTAITRTKAWLRITGAGESTHIIIKEIDAALQMMPNFEFIYPNIEQMNVLQRDLAKINEDRKEFREKFQEFMKEADKAGIPKEELRRMLETEKVIKK